MTSRAKPQEIRLVIEGVQASPISRGAAALGKLTPPPKKAKY